MALRKDEQLRTLDELFIEGHVEKACTLGIIIDSTEAYFDHEHKKFVKKIKIIDESLNFSKYATSFKFGYCTVMFFSEDISTLPKPQAIGDIIYLRRFKFEKYNGRFQGHSHHGAFSYWVLMHGDANRTHFDEYATNRLELNLADEKFEHVLNQLEFVRNCSQKFLQNNSILGGIHPGANHKDTDMIVRVVKKYHNKTVIVRDLKGEYIIEDLQTFAEEGDIAKLRSVAGIVTEGQNKTITKNNFTSLMKLKDWTADYQNFVRLDGKMDTEVDQNIYTELEYLNSAKINEIKNKVFLVKVELFQVAPMNFKAAVKYFDEKKNQVSDSPKKDTTAVYQIRLTGRDESLAANKFVDFHVVSRDGKGGSFLSKVRLDEINEYSTLKQESFEYEEYVNELLESSNVQLKIEVLTDSKNNRLFRVLEVTI